jgi:O-antigen ligase
VGLLISWIPNRAVWYTFEALVFGLVALWTATWLAGKAEARWSWLFVPLFGIVGWAATQLAMNWTEYVFATTVELLRWAAYLGIVFLAAQVFGRPMAGVFRKAFTVYALVVGVVSVLQWFLGNGKVYWLFKVTETASLGPFYNRDHYASFVALAIPTAVVEMRRNPRQGWFYGLAAAVLYATAVAGGSRAGFVVLTLELILLALVLALPGRSVLALAGLIVIFGFVVGWDYLYQRLQLPDPYAGRREVASASLRMWKAKPWTGHGLGTWTDVYPAYAEKDFGVFVNAAHNDWLQWADDGGVPFVACMLVLFFGACALAYRVPWALGVPIVLLHGAIDFPMQGRFLPALVFLVLGVAIRAAGQAGGFWDLDKVRLGESLPAKE